MAELGTAYVQIIPSATGIKGHLEEALGKPSQDAGTNAGKTLGESLVKGLKTVVKSGAIALGAITTASIFQGAKLEQSLGGIETLFDNKFSSASNIVKKYAKEAYKTAGVSANQYMEQVTSFSATLIKSLGGDTRQAADLSNMAMVDMADNSNKMGTSMQDIQNAYQGFAKQNYMMLDNLKLGYGGTKTEMERLLSDATKLTGVKYDINNFSDVISAIHAVQSELNITGTTAKEATTTLSGSFGMLKASFNDFLGNLALGENIEPSMQNLVNSAAIFLFNNLLPKIGNIFTLLPGAIATGIGETLPILKGQLQQMVAAIPTDSLAGKMLNNLKPIALSIVKSFERLPSFFDSIGRAIMPAIDSIVKALSKMKFDGIAHLVETILPAIQGGFKNFMGAVQPAIDMVSQSFVSLWNACQPVVEILGNVLKPIFEILGSFLGGIFSGVLSRIAGLFDVLRIAINILTPVVNVVAVAFEFISPVLSVIAEWIGKLIGLFGNFGGAGNILKNLVVSAWDNIKNAISIAGELIKGAISGIKVAFTVLNNINISLKNIIKMTWEAIKNAISAAGNFIGGIIGKVKNFFNSLGNAGNSLSNVLKNVWNGIVGIIIGAFNGIKSVINSIIAAFSALKSINLTSAGIAIIKGFLGGLKSAYEGVKNFIGGIGNWIREHKGPIQYDRKLLIPAGNAIMKGLDEGLTDSFKNVKSTVNSMGDILSDTFDSELDSNFKTDLLVNAKSENAKLATNNVVSDQIGTSHKVIININGYNKDTKQLAEEVRDQLINEMRRQKEAF